MTRTASRTAATLSTLAMAVLVASCSDTTASKVLTADTACFYNADPSVALTGNLADTLSGGFSGPVRYAIQQAPGNGTVSIASSTGEYSYQATGTGRGDRDQFTFRVTDSGGQQATGTVQVINGQLRIMPVGDSITYGVTSYTSSTGDQPGSAFAVGYRLPLYDMLTRAGPPIKCGPATAATRVRGASSTG